MLVGLWNFCGTAAKNLEARDCARRLYLFKKSVRFHSNLEGENQAKEERGRGDGRSFSNFFFFGIFSSARLMVLFPSKG